jgi:hypothetical protein
LVVPKVGVATLTVLAVGTALAAITQLAVTVVEVGVPVMVQATPVPDTFITVAPVRFVPVRVTGTVVPRVPDVGEIEASVGPTTVNGTVLVFPIGVTTPMFLITTVAVIAMLRVAVTVVELITLNVPATRLTPPPSPFRPVAPVRLLPVMVTGT